MGASQPGQQWGTNCMQPCQQHNMPLYGKRSPLQSGVSCIAKLQLQCQLAGIKAPDPAHFFGCGLWELVCISLLCSASVLGRWCSCMTRMLCL